MKLCTMAKGKKGGSKGKKITLKMAKKALRLTPEGKRRLDLSNMGIDTFPKCLLKLTDLEEVDLSRNQLKKIPDFIGQLIGVLWLDLHSNYIEQLPKSIGQLESLCHLNLCNNSLDSAGLPADIGNLRNLQTLNLGMNRLTALPLTMAALTNLRELGLFDNKITVLPECIRMLPNLKKINTNRNPIAYAQRDAKDTRTTESLYLVREEDLCKLCLEKCREERQRQERKQLLDKSQRRGRLSGLITPNSVARSNQELWHQIPC
ncbi:leucine-rich repeat-containing protein 18 [Tachysurus fulvidraco]|uniref:leucine-rich repeat-containing protein 18 n=1 Tax=Tachysurus fulvidraco TaxID=1234273 RepID=UPI000F4D59FB|nr:leucine-rich repeat-containing protein 18 [Tachysurus fulvidraco]